MKFILPFLSLFTFFTNVSAQAAISPLDEVVSKYRTSKLVSMDVVKTVKSKVLSKETKFVGKIYLSQSKFRWDTDTPEKTQIIFDGKTIWNVQHPSAELPGPIQVAKSKVDKNTKKQILLATLLGTSEVKKNFKVLKTEVQKDEKLYFLEPKGSDLQVKDLVIHIANKKISGISFKDDIGNQTDMNFKNVEFSKKEKSKLFNYAPPKDAQVITL
jgi:outer membrane lipoprotein carrier protein